VDEPADAGPRFLHLASGVCAIDTGKDAALLTPDKIIPVSPFYVPGRFCIEFHTRSLRKSSDVPIWHLWTYFKSMTMAAVMLPLPS